MHSSQLGADLKAQILNALCLEFGIGQLSGEPSFSPFLDADVAEILGVKFSDLTFLYEANILERTSEEFIQQGCGERGCSYWDMVTATACMALLAVGWSRGDAIDAAFLIIDAISGITERIEKFHTISSEDLSEVIEESILYSSLKGGTEHYAYSFKLTARKVSIDILLMHERCLNLTSRSCRNQRAT